jgi:putative resolvase
MLIAIAKAGELLGVCTKTLRRWEKKGLILPIRTIGNHRRYDSDALLKFQQSGIYDPTPLQKTGKAAIYARVSSCSQREDLVRQIDFLKETAIERRYEPLIYSDIGSGMNDKRIGLLRLLKDGLKRKYDCVFITYMDRLARFGTEPILATLKHCNIGITAVHVAEKTDPQQLLVADVIALMTSFSGKTYRMRRGKNAVVAVVPV